MITGIVAHEMGKEQESKVGWHSEDPKHWFVGTLTMFVMAAIPLAKGYYFRRHGPDFTPMDDPFTYWLLVAIPTVGFCLCAYKLIKCGFKSDA